MTFAGLAVRDGGKIARFAVRGLKPRDSWIATVAVVVDRGKALTDLEGIPGAPIVSRWTDGKGAELAMGAKLEGRAVRSAQGEVCFVEVTFDADYAIRLAVTRAVPGEEGRA